LLATLADKVIAPAEGKAKDLRRRIRIEGKLNFGLSIIIVLSVLTLIKLFWPA
jgi:hypothetical protein